MKKLSNFLFCGILASTMLFSTMPAVYAAADDAGNQGGPSESLPKGKAELKNLNVTMRNENQNEDLGKLTNFKDFVLDTKYTLRFEDTLESKEIPGYFHTRFENLSEDIIQIRVASGADITEPQKVIDSKDTGMMRHDSISISALKEGTAKISCTVYDLENPESTKMQTITVTIKKAEAPVVPEVPKNEVTYIGSSDFFKEEAVKQATIDMIKNADKTATINMEMKNDPAFVSLPKEILQTAKDKKVPLTVNVSMNGKMNTWTFPTVDNAVDVNLAMKVMATTAIEPLNIYDGLILVFNHSGALPTGTTVKTYVGDKFKTGEKVQLSYFNENTNALEETKAYTVDEKGYVSVVINHCSNYILEAAKETVEPTPTPTPTEEVIIKETGNAPTKNTVNAIALLAMGFVVEIVACRKKTKKN